MSSASNPPPPPPPPPPSYEATTSHGPSRQPAPQGSNNTLRPQQVRQPAPQGSNNTLRPQQVGLEGTASYVRPAGETIYLVHNQSNQYRAYGQPGTAYVIVGQPTSVVSTRDPNYATATTTVILPTGNCPVCGVGNIVETFNLGLLLFAIFCFPLGLICCLLFTEHRCTHCNHYFH